MKQPATTRRSRLHLVLSDEHITDLTLQTCAHGDDAVGHAKALILLADEIIQRRERAEDIAYKIRKTAFSCLSDEIVEAHVQLLRSELET